MRKLLLAFLLSIVFCGCKLLVQADEGLVERDHLAVFDARINITSNDIGLPGTHVYLGIENRHLLGVTNEAGWLTRSFIHKWSDTIKIVNTPEEEVFERTSEEPKLRLTFENPACVTTEREIAIDSLPLSEKGNKILELNVKIVCQ